MKQSKYKQTGIDKIPDDWEGAKVDDYFDFSRKPRSLNIRDDENIPFIPMDKVSEEYMQISGWEKKKYSDITSGSFVFKNDLIVAKITPSFENGKQAILKNLTKDYAYATTEVWAIHPKNNSAINEYLYYYLKHPEIRSSLAEKMEGSTGRQRLPKGVLQNLFVPFPPLEEQKKIAGVLSAVQEAIEKTENVIKATKELKKSLMQHLFTYGPVPVNEADNVELKTYKISDFPTDWVRNELNKISEIQYGIQAAVAKNTDPNIGIPILTNKNIKLDGRLEISELSYYNLPVEKRNKYLLKSGDILFNWRSGSREHVGKNVFIEEDLNYTFSSFILRFRAKGKMVNNKYLFYYLQYLKDLIKYFEKYSDFMINAKFNASEAQRIPVFIPRYLSS